MFRINRTQFRFDRQQFESLDPIKLSEGIIRIDKALIESHESLRKEVIGMWGDIENYLRHDVGWIALAPNGTILGRCHAAFVGGKSAELSIEVNKSTRGQGVGYQLARQFIQSCLDRDVTPYWSCDTQNVPSYQLAEKLGFQRDRNYSLFTTVYTPMRHEPARQDQ